MSNCLACLTLTEVPSLTAVQMCDISPIVGGYSNVYLIHCGVILTATSGQNPIAALLSGVSMPLSAAAAAMAIANGAPPLTESATIMQMVEWKLCGTFGKSIRGGLQRQDSITHVGGSCETNSTVMNIWRMNFMMTKIGKGGLDADYVMAEKFFNTPRAFHVVAAECGEPDSAILLPSGTYSIAEYNFTRPEDGVREFVSRSFALDIPRRLEPRSYAFPVHDAVEANFI